MEPLYETSASFGEVIAECKPIISSVTVPEAKKRRQPTKHYVYKIVVNWSNGQSTVIYRRYSMFFDFMVKLQELYASLKDSNPSFSSGSQFPLPELPGRVLFGRSEVHQVAEKRRVKVEEFCQALVSLPHEISQSQIVTSFFNTWPDDTLHHSHGIHKANSVHTTNGLSSPTEQVISHPDEMENLEQYRVIGDYRRTDNHQVDLTAGQLVHVIEKHDTGWWMIVTDEEQGYAPAAYLESIDKTYDSLEPEVSSNEEYEAMESYVPQSEDEVGISVGEKVTIVHKSMDGWWKISKKGRTGYCPATIIRRVSHPLTESSPSAESITYESEKSIYEGLNIHKKPPPRRNTIKRSDDIYIVPRQPIPGKVAGTTHDSSDPVAYYKVPRPSHSSSSGSDEDRHGACTSQPFSPNHYEMGPSDNEDESIYENTDFDHPLAPSEGIIHQTVHLYQNTSFDGTPLSEDPKKPLPLKGSQQAKKSPNKPMPPPNKPMSSRYMEDDPENEYINPEEFSIKDDSHKPTPIRPLEPPTSGSTGRVKYVSILPMTSPSDPPPKVEDAESKSDSIKSRSKLTGTKSLGILESSRVSTSPEADDEYIEMDPVYAPVAPDEHNESELKQAPSHLAGPKRKRPPLPVPYNKTHQEESSDIPKVNILKRTKSLEDLLAKNSPDASPLNQKKSDGVKKPLLPSGSKPLPSNGYDHIKPLPNPKPASASPKKPEPAKKKPYHKFKLGGGDSKPEPVISAPVLVESTKEIPTPPPPSLPPPSTSKTSRTYTAIEDYISQTDGCLSFSAGEKCVLVKQSGGWWYVNINGKEGWTPGEFWEEEKRAMTVAFVQPPQVPPQKLPVTKPRSSTTAAILGPDPIPPPPPHFIVHQQSLDLPRTNSIENSPKSSRGRGPPPPKPRPLNSSPPNSRKLEHHGSATEMKFSSPPPPPPPRRAASQANGLGDNTTGDYGLLAEVTTATPIEECSWYVGGMEREKAEQFLIDNGKQREFLVRERVNKKGYYALSIRYHYSVKHFNIDPKPDGSYAMGVMQFSSIEEIVKHYQSNSLFVHEGQSVTLGQPVRRKSSKFSHH